MRELLLPRVAQSLDFTCGAACYDSLLRYFRKDSPGELEIALQLGTLKLGYTPPENIAVLARTDGFTCVHRENASAEELRAVCEAGNVVFVTWWYDDAGHYSLIRSLTENRIELMDPWTARDGRDNEMPWSNFLKHWRFRGARFLAVNESKGDFS